MNRNSRTIVASVLIGSVLLVLLVCVFALKRAALHRDSAPPKSIGVANADHSAKGDPSQKLPGVPADRVSDQDVNRKGMISVAIAKQAAQRFLNRWHSGYRIGPSIPGYAPDGVREVYFAIGYREKQEEPSVADLLGRLARLRAEKASLTLELARAPERKAVELKERTRQLEKMIRGEDEYCTVVVGANDGREPFIASFGGLPPPIFMKDDAMEMRSRQLGGAPAPEPRIIWLAPVFVFFEFPGTADGKPGVCLQAQGSELVPVEPFRWQREPLSPEKLQERRRKWDEIIREAPGSDRK